MCVLRCVCWAGALSRARCRHMQEEFGVVEKGLLLHEPRTAWDEQKVYFPGDKTRLVVPQGEEKRDEWYARLPPPGCCRRTVFFAVACARNYRCL